MSITGYEILTKEWSPEREWATFKEGKSHLYEEFMMSNGSLKQMTACGINLENHLDTWLIEDWRSNPICLRCKRTALGRGSKETQ